MKKYSTFISLLISNIILLIISLSIVAVSYTFFQQSLTRTTQDYTTIILNQLKQTFDEKVSTFNKVILDISNNSHINSLVNHDSPLSNEDIYNSYELINRLADYKVIYSFIESICIYFPKSELLVSNESCYSDFDEYIAISQNSLWNKKDFLDMLNPNCNVTYYPVSDTNDFFTAIVPFNRLIDSPNSPYIILNIQSSFIEDTLKDSNLLHDYKLFIFDGHDNLLFSLGESPVMDIIPHPTFEDISTLSATLESSIYSLTRVDSNLLNWKYFFVTPTSLLPPSTIDLLTLVFILFLILVSIICCILFAYNNYSPVKKLVSLISEISSTPPLTSNGTNEFDLIASSILCNQSQYDQLKIEFSQKLPGLQSQAIEQLLKGIILSWDAFIDELTSLQIIFPNPTFYVICVELGFPASHSLNLSTLVTLKLKNFIHTQLSTSDYIYSIILSPCRLCFIINTAKDKELFSLFITQLHTSCTHFLTEIIPCSLTFGCSDSSQSLVQLSTLYDHAVISLEHQLLTLPAQISYYEQLPVRTYTFYYPSELESKLMSHIKLGNIANVSTLISDVILTNIVDNQLSAQATKCLFFTMMGTAIKTINLLGLNSPDIFIEDAYEKFIHCTNLSDMEVTLREVFLKLCKHISTQNTSDNALFQNILKYIDDNFSNPNLDLTYLAEHFNLSSNYLSRYFKEISGSNFTTYITTIRLNKAKYLLTHTPDSIKEIAIYCGYPNSAGLIRNFKKVFDITPGQFRSQSDL